MEAIVALEDGRLFKGKGFGARSERGGEVVFNTSLTGYQEIFTDPSYAGQIVCLTYPHIGNVGTNLFDNEAPRPYIEALVVRDFSQLASNWRSQQTAEDFLARHHIPVLSHIDTRALVRHLRLHGNLRAILSTLSTDSEALVKKARALPAMVGLDLARTVTTAEKYEWKEPSLEFVRAGKPVEPQRFHVVAYDYGIKQNILRRLVDVGCRVTVVPALTPAEDVLAMKPDGVFLSNGPGDPEPCAYGIAAVRKLAGRVPIFGICLGHQIVGLALGGKTYKLKFGHHGANHPVKNLQTGKVEITSQNHGFAVDPDSLPAHEVELTHMNLNDSTLEGLRHRSLPLFSVQYHPEASPGPHDSHYLFKDFFKLMEDFER
ncbi:glutamine-hydrolyzing carbamoyl-phosphate synthase small subunit [Acidobacteriia bacterium AH_259_A11_L15]|nr:glutamine-hydrolyzing carbamoyl-phosphate synthase small subunit [Acidobacteriia bacterium AH_259_A11_L15]